MRTTERLNISNIREEKMIITEVFLFNKKKWQDGLRRDETRTAMMLKREKTR